MLLGGSADNECVKLAWRRENPALDRLNHYAFGDVKGELIDQLGVRDRDAGTALLATFIVDADNTIQHVSVDRLEAGCRPEDILRVLDALQGAARATR
ncbi:MAG: Alkyl hydroperoxide reductase C [Burkholderia gladioli]|nr:MAG: Alkyl hydroperoxide reductase C [Burkholderia gladioli]